MSDTIDDKIVEVTAQEIRLQVLNFFNHTIPTWERSPENAKDDWRDTARAALKAALPMIAAKLAKDLQKTCCDQSAARIRE